jgi:hypothetical protein
MKKGVIEEYKELTATCSRTDSSNKASVRQHNKAVTRMYKIVDEISKSQTQELLNQFIELLNIADNKTNIWAAIHMLERLNIDNETEAKALSIIKAESEGDSADALGYKIWLNTWAENKK